MIYKTLADHTFLSFGDYSKCKVATIASKKIEFRTTEVLVCSDHVNRHN